MARLDTVQTGDELRALEHQPNEIDLFLYNAALWNPHRIHFDRDYATRAEGYPGLVVPGPLQGDWMAQRVEEWMGEGATLVSIEYSNRRAAYLGETLRSGGRITAVDPDKGLVSLELFVCNEQGDVIAPGSAVVRFQTG